MDSVTLTDLRHKAAEYERLKAAAEALPAMEAAAKEAEEQAILSQQLEATESALAGQVHVYRDHLGRSNQALSGILADLEAWIADRRALGAETDRLLTLARGLAGLQWRQDGSPDADMTALVSDHVASQTEAIIHSSGISPLGFYRVDDPDQDAALAHVLNVLSEHVLLALRYPARPDPTFLVKSHSGEYIESR